MAKYRITKFEDDDKTVVYDVHASTLHSVIDEAFNQEVEGEFGKILDDPEPTTGGEHDGEQTLFEATGEPDPTSPKMEFGEDGLGGR